MSELLARSIAQHWKRSLAGAIVVLLGLGLGILIDVLILRLVVAPAVVTLLGHRAWWLPGWLDRLLPDVSI